MTDKKPTKRQVEVLDILAANANNVIVYSYPYGCGPSLVYYEGKGTRQIERTKHVIRTLFWNLRDAGWLRQAPEGQWRITDTGRAVVGTKP